MSNKIKIGVMGCANIAKRTVIPTIKSLDAYELVAISSRTPKKAQEFAQLFNCEAITGYGNLLTRNDIDVVYMPLPTGLHEEWVLKTLDAGKHILIEKSLAENYASAQKMVEKAKAKQLLIMEDFMFLYHSQHQFVKDLIAQGEIGELRCFRSSFGFPPFRDEGNFRYNKSLGGGALLDAAAYTVRASQLFLGDDLTVEAARLNVTEGKEVDIFGGAFLTNPAGIVAELAFGFDNYYQCNYELWGSKGKIVAHKSFTPRSNEKPLITLEKQDLKQQFNVDQDDHFKNIFTEFARCVRESNFESKYREILNQSQLLQAVRDKGSK